MEFLGSQISWFPLEISLCEALVRDEEEEKEGEAGIFLHSLPTYLGGLSSNGSPPVDSSHHATGTSISQVTWPLALGTPPLLLLVSGLATSASLF